VLGVAVSYAFRSPNCLQENFEAAANAEIKKSTAVRSALKIKEFSHSASQPLRHFLDEPK